MKIGIGLGVCSVSGAAAALPVLEFGPLSLIPTIGSATVTETRTTGDTFKDSYGVLRTVAANEIIVPGARRAKNLLANPTALSGASWTRTQCTAADNVATDPNGGTTASAVTATSTDGQLMQTVATTLAGRKFTFPAWVRGVGNTIGKTGKIWIYGATATESLASRTTTLTSAWKRITISTTFLSTAVSTSVVYRIETTDPSVSGEVIHVWRPLAENTTGIADTPGEWVDSNLDYGAGAVGTRYFGTTNGNTVDGSGVVTEATGAALTGIKGPQVSRAATNLSTYSRDFTNAVWTKINQNAPALTATGIDGAANAASVLSEDAAAGVARTCSLTGAQANSTIVTLQACVAPNGRNWAYLQFTRRDGTVKRAYCNISTGVMGTIDADITAGYVGTFANSMAHFYAVASVGTGASAPLFALGFCAADNTPTYNGDGTSGVKVDAFQQVSESTPTSLILTTGGTASRTATFASMPCPSTLKSGAPWTLVKSFSFSYPSTTLRATNDPIFMVGNGANLIKIMAQANTTALYLQLVIASAQVFSATGSALTWTAGQTIKLALRYSPATGYAMWVNGAAYVSNSSVQSAAWESLYPISGIDDTGSKGAQSSASTRVYASVLSDARCIAETTP